VRSSGVGRRAALAAPLIGLLWLLAAPSCRRAPVALGPIVLITFDGLRADVVGSINGGGEKGLTPSFDSFAAAADWAGRGIAPSSWTAPSMASLWTGLRPWQHQAIDGTRAALGGDLRTLPEALQAAGYRTSGFPSGPWLTPRLGYGRGFDELASLGDGDAAVARLEHLQDREFVWLHIPEPHVPWVRRPWLRDALRGEVPGGLPRSVEAADLGAYFDPRKPLAGEDRETYWALYRLNVAWADQRLGRFLDAVKASGRWKRALVVVTAVEGEELGEDGLVLTGGGLCRELIEVPLAIKLPRRSRRLAVPRGARPAIQRLFATLLEAAGGAPAPATAPSLFRAPGSGPVLSELYLSGGADRFSLVDGDDQLLWVTRFAPPSPAVYRASFESILRPLAPPLAPPAGLARLTGAFAAARPLSGSPPLLSLRRWEAGSGSRPLVDPRRRTALAGLLGPAWRSFLGEETTPAEEARDRAVPAL